MSSVKRLPPSAGQETAAKVLEFIGRTVARPFAPVVTEVDRVRAAQVIQMPVRRGITKASAERPSVAVIHKVAECVDKLFPTLRGAVREQMIAAVSQKISEDPHIRRIIG